MSVARHALLVLVLALTVAGCRREEPTDSAQPAAGAAATLPEHQPAPAEALAPTSGMDATRAPAVPGAGEPVTPNGADLGLADSAQHGRYLVDATGKTLYMLEKDSNGASTCQGACTTEWPPLLAQQGTPRTLDPALDDSAVGVIQRHDGTQQVTFNGHPLYHYVRDTAAGLINGAGRKDQFGEWYLLGPEGNTLQGH